MNKENKIELVVVENHLDVDGIQTRSEDTSIGVYDFVGDYKEVIKLDEKVLEEEAKIKAYQTQIAGVKKWISNRKDDMKAKALHYMKNDSGAWLETTKIVKDRDGEPIVDENGEVTFKTTRKATLPLGMSYAKGREKIEYHEDVIPQDYFKMTLQKTKVKKAIEDGALNEECITKTIGEPSITIKNDTFIRKAIEKVVK